MSPSIFVVNEDESLVPMSDSPYGTEDELQRLIEEYPQVLAAWMSGDPTQRYVLVKREAGVPDRDGGSDRWSLDHLMLDQEAVPTFVEVKRSSDSRIRREVVGQMLDYAANGATYWDAARLRGDFEQTCRERNKDPDEVLADLAPEGDVETFWRTVKVNLESRKIRLLFVADEIPHELQSIIELLNEQMKTIEVLGIEVRQFASATDDGSKVRTLVSTIIGNTAAAADAKDRRPPAEVTTEEKLITQVGVADPAGAPVVGQLLRWGEGRGMWILWGTATSGSCYLVAESCRPLYLLGTGWVYVALNDMIKAIPFDTTDLRQGLLARVNAIPGMSAGNDAGKSFRVRLSALADPDRFRTFTDAVSWFVDEVAMRADGASP